MKPSTYMRLTRPLRPHWRERLFHQLPAPIRRRFWQHIEQQAEKCR